MGMKLIFCECTGEKIPKEYRDFFGKAFPLLAKKLGISSYNAEIKIHFNPPAFPGDRGKVGPTNEDSMLMHKYGKAPRHFQMNITPDNLFYMCETWCHEMVHVDQYVTGRLAGKGTTPETAISTWNGIAFPNTGPKSSIRDNLKAEMEMPWEKEAYGRMAELGAWVWEKLGKGPVPARKSKSQRDFDRIIGAARGIPELEKILRKLLKDTEALTVSS